MLRGVTQAGHGAWRRLGRAGRSRTSPSERGVARLTGEALGGGSSPRREKSAGRLVEKTRELQMMIGEETEGEHGEIGGERTRWSEVNDATSSSSLGGRGGRRAVDQGGSLCEGIVDDGERFEGESVHGG